MTMVFTFDYDRDFAPSMPVAEIRIGRPRTEPQMILRAILDSGADATIIPEIYLKQLGARQNEKVWMRGTAYQRRLVDLYTISLQLGDFERRHLLVVGRIDETEVIVGRDVLNQLIVTLNGLAAVTEISS
jgi:hypothetical protein